MPMSAHACHHMAARISKQAQNTAPMGAALVGNMKHLDKAVKALEFRKANTPKANGFKTPGSLNKRKTGYFRGKR